MSSSNYQHAVLMNNQGVQHFERGQFEQARDNFREALEAIKGSMVDAKPTVSSHTTNASCGFRWSSDAPLHAELNLPVPAGASFIFRRALVIVPVSNIPQPMTDLSEESTAVIYNLALSCLVLGFVSNSSKLLRTGAKFFEIVLAIRCRKSESVKLGWEEVLLDAAICNNLGWIYGEFCDYALATQYFEQVSSRLNILGHGGFVCRQAYEGFITNLISGVHPHLAAAA
jgi:tetratricopeptide (TPR) repeat protein